MNPLVLASNESSDPGSDLSRQESRDDVSFLFRPDTNSTKIHNRCRPSRNPAEIKKQEKKRRQSVKRNSTAAASLMGAVPEASPTKSTKDSKKEAKKEALQMQKSRRQSLTMSHRQEALAALAAPTIPKGAVNQAPALVEVKPFNADVYASSKKAKQKAKLSGSGETDPDEILLVPLVVFRYVHVSILCLCSRYIWLSRYAPFLLP